MRMDSVVEAFQPTQRTLSLDVFAARFWAKVDSSAGDGCWHWQGTLSGDGHGRVRMGAWLWQAHRVAYELLVGPIPLGLVLDHLCSNPRCVNPAHLDPVTGRENTLRGRSPSARHAQVTHCPAGHAYDQANTTHSGGRRYCRACLRERGRRRRAEARMRA